ncbi:hypothetical protein D9757_007633 [Collybiopsis confluens]|uniref:F-box domain-containing protein n=1 Tax=Collybiopsis confluens TaxID=2823264 RepID=A0A8H5H9R7_9AGAR|nr:hypothetical protein D9757_007633 [Collybiopsis confluens]
MSGPFPHQPRFPNKIFSLIIDNLAHHPPPTLRNLAIVCKEFSHRTRPLLFRNIDLPSSLRVQAFAEFLRDPSRTALLGQYVQSLSYGPGKDTDLPYLETIIRSLPSLTSVKLYLPDISFFPAIEAHLAGKITKLHIECLEYLDSEELQSFKSMLASLNGLRHLSMMVARMSYDDDDEIILPTSLETLSLVFLEMDFMMLRAIKRGMQGSSRVLLGPHPSNLFSSSLINLWNGVKHSGKPCRWFRASKLFSPWTMKISAISWRTTASLINSFK